jgi:methyltransferase (TIGR00027 family)
MVGQGRAAADARLAPGRFADPIARELLRPAELAVVDLVRAGTVPHGWRARVDYETVRASSEMMPPRTVLIDEAIRERPAPQVVILGAGLDGRNWRLPELRDAAVFEVDTPASQADKRDRAARLPGEPPTWVAVDFARDRLGDALAAAGHRADAPTTWVWEGVVPYLTPADVDATTAAIAAASAAGSRLVVNYQVRARAAVAGRLVARLLAASTGRRSVWAREPWRSTWTPAELAALLDRHGFATVRDTDLYAAAVDLGTPTTHRVGLRHGRVLVADRAAR